MPSETDTATDPSPEVPAVVLGSHEPAVSGLESPGVGSVAVPDASGQPAGEGAGSPSDDDPAEGQEEKPEPAPAPPKRPRGRPRKDGLPPGSPEAKAADANRGAEPAPVVEQVVETPPTEPAPAGAGSPPKVREQERTQRPKHPRARPLSEQPKQEPPKNVCTNQNCRAVHPSQGGKAGVRCVETGALVVAPLGREEGRQLMRQILSWIGKIVSYAFGGEVSDPTDMELGLITPPAIRILHRFGIGEGNFTLDILMLLAGLSMYTMRVVQEARSGGQRVALPAAS